MRVLCSIVGIAALIVFPIIGFVALAGLGEVPSVLGALVGLVLGIIALVLIGRFANYLFKAGQIAMITEGVSTGTLPQDAYAAGRQAVKERFATASAFFGLYTITKAITNEITAGVNTLAGVVGGASGNNAASGIAGLVSTVVNIVVEYLNYCSLGWVFYKKDENPFKSTCDGAVIYFQNWKVLLKNAGKVLGITILSLVVVGAVLFGIFYLIFSSILPLVAVMSELDVSLSLEEGEIPPGTMLIVLSVLVALIFWAALHSAFVGPYILVSVMRRYFEAAWANPPKIDLYGKLCGISKGFCKALDKAELPTGAERPAAPVPQQPGVQRD